jgi:hypothetical protein
MDSGQALSPSKAAEPLELLELDFSDDGLNEAKRLNGWNDWNCCISKVVPTDSQEICNYQDERVDGASNDSARDLQIPPE